MDRQDAESLTLSTKTLAVYLSLISNKNKYNMMTDKPLYSQTYDPIPFCEAVQTLGYSYRLSYPAVYSISGNKN